MRTLQALRALKSILVVFQLQECSAGPGQLTRILLPGHGTTGWHPRITSNVIATLGPPWRVSACHPFSVLIGARVPE